MDVSIYNKGGMKDERIYNSVAINWGQYGSGKFHGSVGSSIFKTIFKKIK